jgi:hypothetical protein
MTTRLIAWLTEEGEPPAGIHFRGLPPELTEGQDRREQLPQPRFLMIEEKSKGVFLFRFMADGRCVGDTWHLNVEDAKEQAEYEYKGFLTAWSDVPVEVENPIAFALKQAS